MLVFTVFVLILTSCAVTETFDIKADGSGESLSDIDVEQYFVDVLTDFSEFLPSQNESIMDSTISGFSSMLNAAGSASNVRFVKTGENSYTGYFSFDELSTLADELYGGKQSVIKQSENSFSFYLDIENYEEIEKIVPFLADPNVEVFLAKYNIGYSEEDYLDMIVFSLGEEAPESIRGSLITIQGTVEGVITKVENGVKLSDSSWAFTFPLIDFLLLSHPISFSVSWI